RQYRAQILDGILERLGRELGRRWHLAETLRQQRRHDPRGVRALLLQRLDEKTQSAQRLGEELEVFGTDRGFGVRVAVDLLFAEPQQMVSGLLLQHLEGAANLMNVLAQGRN